MVRGMATAVGAAVVLVAGVTGCAGAKKAETVTSGSVSASAGDGTARVTIDGRPRDIKGKVVCATTGGNVNIAIGEQTTGVAVSMASDGSSVASVGLGNIDGVVLGYQAGAPGGEAKATRDGSSYTITGTATGVDMANPMQPVTKPFQIEVSCP